MRSSAEKREYLRFAATIGPSSCLVDCFSSSPTCLPQNSSNTTRKYEPQFVDSALWLETQFDSVWNSTNQDAGDWTEQDLQRVWRFPHGTPLHSDIWCTKARKFAQRALQSRSLIAYGQLTSRFAVHISRLVLMLADHDYSSRPATSGWQSPEYSAWANTDTDTKALKQKLDEHNVGVGQNALLLGRCLPKLRQTLPAITRHKGFKQRTSHARFRWQDTAFDTAAALRERSVQQGFLVSIWHRPAAVRRLLMRGSCMR